MHTDTARTPSRPIRARFAERLLLERFSGISRGRLRVLHEGRTYDFGSSDPREPRQTLVIHDPAAFTRVALGGTLGAGESYMDGDWSSDDLTGLIRLLLRNPHVVSSLESGFARAGLSAASALHEIRRNTRRGSRRNIRAHYDLGNDFFARLLDPTLSYSSAIFPSETSTLEEGSLHKIDLVLDAVELEKNDHLLEIGTGWGTLALRAAETRGARVTTTTISEEQRRFATERVSRSAQRDRVRVLPHDYRDLAGVYDKIVSVEMIEAVGARYYDTFFERCARLLKPGGSMALQAITIADQAFERHCREADFIKKHIFPGSTIPSVTALASAATRASDLRLMKLDDYGPHYARTLSEWRENLLLHRDWVVRRYGERFFRMWVFYLSYCEAGFAEGYLSVVHLVFRRPERRPL